MTDTLSAPANSDPHARPIEGNQAADGAINQRIFETSLDLILVVDKRGLIIRVSPGSQAILGYHPNEMVGHVDNTREEMRRARRGRETRHFECRYVHKLGQARIPVSECLPKRWAVSSSRSSPRRRPEKAPVSACPWCSASAS